ncbi:MAG TPA: prolyl oligopeptidase family serine peptidase [Roseiflexaceae bacterium]|nr:prolyl oligopeptidase family serine peptidase [Roseiflexaceae bacterium]
MVRIESLLSARLFMAPQAVGDRLFFVSNLSGRISLYAMDRSGGVPEPLLPPHIALQNPELIGGYLFHVLPQQGKILVMIDSDGDERYQPMLIPIDGGFPEPAFGEQLAGERCNSVKFDDELGLVYLVTQANDVERHSVYRGDLRNGELELLDESRWGNWLMAVNSDHSRAVIGEGYTVGDTILFDWRKGRSGRHGLYGTPLEQREPGKQEPLTAFGAGYFTPGDRGLLLVSALFEDTYGLAYLPLDGNEREVRPVTLSGVQHSGMGELIGLDHVRGDRYAVTYNIDGCTWIYEGRFDEAELHMRLEAVICGTGALAGGVVEHFTYDPVSDSYALAFASATSPAQIFTVGGADRTTVVQHTRERVLGVPEELLAPGEDASFTSHDGLRVSARLYLPAPALGFSGPRPLVYYVHGGPQGQERPNFAWFSMPLIQFLTLNGFAVFVPNARGSTGYGLAYTKHVDHDWGGQDRLDHVHAMGLLAKDPRVDAKRAAVVGRSYGGYMTLTLAGRHPELWSAAVDMFGPYDLLTFIDRLPESWKSYFAIAVGDPVKDRDFLVERSPRSYIHQIGCPLLVIQGKNDPRVIERESRDVVEQLQGHGKPVEYLMFEDEGHDVLKFANRVRCYNAITDFFKRHLMDA